MGSLYCLYIRACQCCSVYPQYVASRQSYNVKLLNVLIIRETRYIRMFSQLCGLNNETRSCMYLFDCSFRMEVCCCSQTERKKDNRIIVCVSVCTDKQIYWKRLQLTPKKRETQHKSTDCLVYRAWKDLKKLLNIHNFTLGHHPAISHNYVRLYSFLLNITRTASFLFH